MNASAGDVRREAVVPRGLLVTELLLATPGLLLAGVFAYDLVFEVFRPGGGATAQFFLGLASGLLLLVSAATGPAAIIVFLVALVKGKMSPRQAVRLGLILVVVLAPWAWALAFTFRR